MRPQKVTVRQAPIIQWEEGGFRWGYKLKAREQWLDGLFMGYTHDEAVSAARQLAADRERVGKPIVVTFAEDLEEFSHE